MKKRHAIPIFILLGVLAVLTISFFSDRSIPLADVIERAFEYKLKDPAEILERKCKYAPPAPHGLFCFEDTKVRLSDQDAQALMNKLKKDPRFVEKEFVGNKFFECFIVGEKLVSYRWDGKEPVLSYSYYEY